MELCKRQMEQLVEELDVERDRTSTLRKELKNYVQKLARYERQAQSQSMEQDVATTGKFLFNCVWTLR